MNKKIHILPLVAVAITIFQIIRSNAPPQILNDSKITLLKGYDEYNCGYGNAPSGPNETCLSGVNANYPSIESVHTFYAFQMETLGWVKTPVSRHEDSNTEKGTEFFLRETSTRCKMERAISVNQNIYRGGVKLDDISIHFSEYLVDCDVPYDGESYN